MKIYVRGFKSNYDTEHLTRVFYKDATVTKKYPVKEDCVAVFLKGEKIIAGVRIGKKVYIRKTTVKPLEKPEFTASALIYEILKELTGKTPPWGLLTGVRPVRLIHDMWASGKDDVFVENRFKKDFDVSEEKYNLSMKTAKHQRKAMDMCSKNSCSVYVSIPFCPSRCSYCSFVSQTTSAVKKLIYPYTELLCKEIEEIANQVYLNNLNVETIYIGGGTPTALDAMNLRMLMECIKKNFDLNTIKEYTVEAGRPDCTDIEKLAIIKELGATRISINPQTLNDEVLREIGRAHSVKDVIDCYDEARKLGHKNINMDLIAGLPKDTVASFEDSLKGVIALAPENITIHTLTLKRASNIVIQHKNSEYDDVEQMIQKCDILGTNGYEPYYLYRQKNTLQNLENTGFSKEGFDGLYNIFIMEEVHSILSAGAGGVTKLKNNEQNRIERIFNFKYPMEYCKDFDEIIRRKQGISDFYK